MVSAYVVLYRSEEDTKLSTHGGFMYGEPFCRPCNWLSLRYAWQMVSLRKQQSFRPGPSAMHRIHKANLLPF